MNIVVSMPTTWEFSVLFCLAVLFYLLTLAIYRLYLSPIANFPGPKLAALSNWYEFYFDVVKQGKFTFHIQELHKKYGPIIRITPTELHIDDPEYLDILYARTNRRNKYAYFANHFGGANDTFNTADHDQHKRRRKAISSFFSIAKINQVQDVIHEKVEKLCRKFVGYAQTGEVVSLEAAWTALTTDIITEYAFGRCYDELNAPGFTTPLAGAFRAVSFTAHFALHFGSIVSLITLIPGSVLKIIVPGIFPIIRLKKDMHEEVLAIHNGSKAEKRSGTSPTIMHEILNSDLPTEDKSDKRLSEEAQLLLAAGLLTTSWALTLASFHITRNPSIVSQLRAELKGAGVTNAECSAWQKLEKLKYLKGCVQEAIRLSIGIPIRNPRLAPNIELVYGKWKIPKNTPVSMTALHVLMNKEIFTDPESFVPERWIDNTDLERYFVPFGKGTRTCLGINLAYAELYTTIAAVFSRFTFELYETDSTDVEHVHAYMVPYPRWESKGVRAHVRDAVL